MTRALALLPLLTLTACAIEPETGRVVPEVLSVAFLLGAAACVGLTLEFAAYQSLALVVGPALMAVVLLILAGAF